MAVFLIRAHFHVFTGLFLLIGFLLLVGRLQYFFAARCPWAFPEYPFGIFGKDHLTLHQQFGKLVMPVLVFQQQLLGAGILLGNECFGLVVDEFGSLLAVGLVKLLLAVVVADVGQLVAHASIGNHAVSLLGHALQVVHGAGRDMSGEELFCCTSAKYRAHLIEHLLFGSYLSFFG